MTPVKNRVSHSLFVAGMKSQPSCWLALATLLLATSLPTFAKDKQPEKTNVATQVVVTIEPDKHGAPAAALQAADLSVKEDYKAVNIVNVQPLPAHQPIQLVIYIDDSLQPSSSLQFADLKKFIGQLPANVQVAIAYMQSGHAVMASGFTSDRRVSANSVRLPMGQVDIDASPYFCLSSLAKHWPEGSDPSAIRQVLMITDGIDRYFAPRQYNPEDPYVATAISDAQKNHLIVSSIYFRDMGRVDRGMNAAFIGDSYLLNVAQGTGGTMYSSGLGNPVTLVPFFDNFSKRLSNQYVLTFDGYRNGLQPLEVKGQKRESKLDAPNAVVIGQQILAATK